MPKPQEAVLLLVLVVGVIGFGLVAVSAAYEDTPDETVAVTDEAFVQDVGNWTAVDAASEGGVTGFSETVTVRNASGGELGDADYTWNATDGTVLIEATQNTTDGADASIDYEYTRRPEQATAMLAPIRMMFDIGGILPLVIAAGTMFVGVRWLWEVSGANNYGGRR